MKKLIALFALVLSFGATGQIDGGTMIAGGNAYFNHYINRSDSVTFKQTTVTISPQFGIAFADNFVAGAYFSFSAVKDFSTWSVGPFVRYYMKNFYAQLGYGYTRTGDVGQSATDISLGYAIFFNDYVALEPALYYNQYFNNGLNGSDLGAKIGFQIYFNR